MKSFHIFRIIGFIGFAIFAACNKDLDLAPESNYNANDFYHTETEFKQAIYATYGGLNAINGQHYPLMMEGLSDNISTATNNNFTHLTFNEAESDVLSLWSNYWIVITRSNNILNQIDAGAFGSEDARNTIKGEAYFLRGYAYFQLGWLYGGVPLLDKPTEALDILKAPRSSQEETMAFAASDFQQAAKLLPAAQTGADLGRATSFAAKGLLARLYVFTKNYSAAQPLLEDILASPNYKMYDNYLDCFLNTKDNGSEFLFQIQYTSGLSGLGNALPYSLVPENIRSPMFPNGGRSLWLRVSQDLYESYETGDLRRDVTIQKGYTTSSNQTDNSTLLYVKLAHGTVPTAANDNDVNISVLRITDVKLMYAEVLNELGYQPDGEAFTQLNDVRHRAGLDPFTATDAPDQEHFREKLFQERRVEFACESLRWFDIIRQGEQKANDIMSAFLARPEEGSDLYKFDPRLMLLPIPSTERQSNPGIGQNPGY